MCPAPEGTTKHAKLMARLQSCSLAGWGVILSMVSTAIQQCGIVGDLDLVFPNKLGNVETLGNMTKRGFYPAQVAAGVIAKRKPKYTGFHALRHFYASWLINRKADGGLELPPKTVQSRLGHSSITLTLDRYAHLFPNGDDGGELDAAELALVKV
jgi:integrase